MTAKVCVSVKCNKTGVFSSKYSLKEEQQKEEQEKRRMIIMVIG